ncbi:response regulator [Chloroflexia bacterium SDU3-3]|nr:response regulator [Chloroflexia bacterium SDU3-3]
MCVVRGMLYWGRSPQCSKTSEVAMWQGLVAEAQPEFRDAMRTLLESTTRTMIASIGALYAVWHVVAVLSWPVQLGGQVWLTSLVLGSASALALVQIRRRLLLAQAVWLAGLAGTISVALLAFRQPQLAYIYALLPLAAVVLIGYRAGLAMLVVVAAIVWAMGLGGDAPLPADGMLAIPVAGAVAWLLGWASSHTLATVTQWSLFSFRQSQESLAVAQEQRGQLSHMLKDLDQAYYRLERANAALVAARKRAEDAERFKAEFVTNISHELRTPLNLIVGFSEVMMTAPQSYQDVPLPGIYRRDMNAIYRSAQHLLSLVDDVLDMARIESGKIALAREQVDLGALASEALETMRDYIRAKGLALEVEIEAGLPPFWIDRVRVRQVLLNLLVNATRFTQRGAIGLQISREGDMVVVRVRDTGTGIPEPDLPKVFEAFRTTEQPMSEWHSGTGLGLPISKQFIELHQGKMGVASVLGEGSTFWFTLPCARQPQPEAVRSQAGRWVPVVPLGASEKIVVVVHDDAQVAALLQRHLDGYRVLAAPSLAEGAAMAAELHAIALVTDSSAPAPAPGLAVPHIQCPLPSSHQAALLFGARDMLVKPVSRERLLAALATIDAPIRRMLVVDDDPDMARLVQRMLATLPQPPACLVAHNGAEALALLQENEVDLVLMDLAMPGMNGHELLEQLGGRAGPARPPVIIISGQDQGYSAGRLAGQLALHQPQGWRLGQLIAGVGALLATISLGWGQEEPAAPARAAAPSAR